MNRCQADDWSIGRSLAFLAAVFAITLGTLMPFAAMAASHPGQPIFICSSEGLQTVHVGGLDGPIKQQVGAKCAACIMPLQADLPLPPAPVPSPGVRLVETVVWHPQRYETPPPARAPPRPPSQAPPHV